MEKRLIKNKKTTCLKRKSLDGYFQNDIIINRLKLIMMVLNENSVLRYFSFKIISNKCGLLSRASIIIDFYENGVSSWLSRRFSI